MFKKDYESWMQKQILKFMITGRMPEIWIHAGLKICAVDKVYYLSMIGSICRSHTCRFGVNQKFLQAINLIVHRKVAVVRDRCPTELY